MTLITYQHRPVAMAGPNRFYLAPHIDQRPDGDPLKRFVCFLALYARDVQLDHLPGEPHRYLPCRAERYARAALVPRVEFAAHAHRPDHELAERFGVPVEQITQRREDLAWLASTAGRSHQLRCWLECSPRRTGCQHV